MSMMQTKNFGQITSIQTNLFNLGLTKTHIKKLISQSPEFLLSGVEKTLQPKVSYLRGLGLSGLDLANFLVGYDRVLIRGLDSHLIPRVEFLRKLLGTDEKVVLALKKFVLVPGNKAAERMEQNVVLLRNNGFSDDDIAKFVLENPIRLFVYKTQKFQDVLHQVEHEWGIPRNAKMFYHGIGVLLKSTMSRIDMKFKILRSYGWSDVEITRMVRTLPPVLNLSGAKMRNALDYFMKEVGCTPDYLAFRPAVLTLSLEGRVKPRHEVLKILSEKKLKLNNRKFPSFTDFYLRESEFQNKYLLPYKGYFARDVRIVFEKGWSTED